MPRNNRKLDRRLNTCDTRLSALFDGLTTDQLLKEQIQAVKDYYDLSYDKAMTTGTAEDITRSYELFVDQLTEVKAGTLEPRQALEKMQEATESRKIDAVFFNLAKACELIFWAATTFALYSAVFGVALPVLIVQPVLGVAVGIAIVGAMSKTAANAIGCLTEFKSFTRHDTEYTNQQSLVRFFQPARREKAEALPQVKEETKEMVDKGCCSF